MSNLFKNTIVILFLIVVATFIIVAIGSATDAITSNPGGFIIVIFAVSVCLLANQKRD